MSIQTIEVLMANVSEILMTPVIIAIVVLFIYAIFALGRFISEYCIRKKHSLLYQRQIDTKSPSWLRGFDIHNYFIKHPNASEDEYEVFALKQLETLRIVTRIAPMLGLIATMIPMGPALDEPMATFRVLTKQDDFASNVILNWAKQMTKVNEGKYQTPGYGTVDWQLSYRLADTQLNLAVNNIFDKEYYQHNNSAGHDAGDSLANLASAGRNFSATIKYNF